MKNLLSFSLIIFSSLLYSQNVDQAIAEVHYKKQVSNAAYEKALNDMQSSATRSSEEKLNQLNEKFELNFAQKEKYESKVNALYQKKIQIENKINQSKSKTEKNSLQEKVTAVNLEIEKVNEKLIANENDLKVLQKSYNKIMQ